MHCVATYFTHARTLKAFVFKVLRNALCRYILHTCSHLESIRVQSATEWTASVHIPHTCSHLESVRVQSARSATEWTASVHTLHMPIPNVTRVQSATEWTASVHTLHMPIPNVTRVQSATEWTASVHTSHMPKPNVTRVQSATEWTSCVAPAERCNPFKLGCAKPQNFCLHSCQAISDGERSWRKSHGCLCAQLETAAQVRQTKHTGVQKTEEKKPGPLRGCQRSENTRNHWNTHDMYMDIDIIVPDTHWNHYEINNINIAGPIPNVHISIKIRTKECMLRNEIIEAVRCVAATLW